MVVRKDIKLPRWAKLMRPDEKPTTSLPSSLATNGTAAQKAENLDRQACLEEMLYMRKRCYHILSKQMDRCMDQVNQEATKPCLATLQDFLDAAAPPMELRRPATAKDSSSNNSDEDDKMEITSRKRQRIDLDASEETTPSSESLTGLDSALFDEQQEAWAPQDPLLLPIILLQCPSFFGLDRSVHLDQLVQGLRNSREQCAVVKVEPKTTQSSGKRRVQWMRELVLQCHKLFPILSEEPLRRRIIKRRKKKACTFSDLLLLWAQNVPCYKELVVFINADDSFYSSELQDFLHVLAAKRAEQGIPINVVLLAPHDGRRCMELRSSLQGYAGFMIRSETLPSPDHIIQQFRHVLWHEQKFPVMFPPQVFQYITRSYLHHNKSAYCALAKFRKALAHYFACHHGSLLAVANNETILTDIWQRIAWFLVDEKARNVLLDDGDDMETVSSSSSSLLQSSKNVLDNLQRLHMRKEQSHLILQLIDSLRRRREKKALDNDNNQSNNLFYPLCCPGSLQGLSRRGMLEELVQLRQKLTLDSEQMDRIGAKPDCRELLTKYVNCESMEASRNRSTGYRKILMDENLRALNELIVLVGKSRDGDDLTEFEELLMRWGSHGEPSDDKEDEDRDRIDSYFPLRLSAASVCSSEPRKEIVDALVCMPEVSRGYKHLPMAYVSAMMYRLIHDRVAVTQEDWYDEFWKKLEWQDKTANDGSREQSFVLFSCGLRYLKQCGLVAEKLRTGSRSDIVYERAKLVWCGGH